MTKDKEGYLQDLLGEPSCYLGFMRESEEVRNDISPSVGLEIGHFLRFLVISSRARRILEVGTSIGYSTAWLAMGASVTDGLVDTVEMQERLLMEAVENLSALGLSDRVRSHLGKGEDILPSLQPGYDLIFLDGATQSLMTLYEKSIPLLSRGGLLVIEDVLFAVTGKRKIQREAMGDLNAYVLQDQRFITTMLHIGDGLLLCCRK